MHAQAQVELVKMQEQDAINIGNVYRKIIHSLKKEICEMNTSIKKLWQVSQQKIKMVKEVKTIQERSTRDLKLLEVNTIFSSVVFNL